MFVNRCLVLFIYGLGLMTVIQSHAQTCNPNISRAAPDSRYEFLNNDTEVKDNQTGLIWQRCSIGQNWNGITCVYSGISAYNWAEAMYNTKIAGNGWRVPNIKELRSLVEEACYEPAINEHIFPNSWPDRYYWSSSPVAYPKGHIWTVYLKTGLVGSMGFLSSGSGQSNSLILVRDGSK